MARRSGQKGGGRIEAVRAASGLLSDAERKTLNKSV